MHIDEECARGKQALTFCLKGLHLKTVLLIPELKRKWEVLSGDIDDTLLL